MAKTKRSREDGETYESDGGFVSNDDGNAPKSKRSKKAGVSKPKSDSEDKFWALSSGRTQRRVGISEFKSNKLINIREFYEKDDEYLPGKKGISLNIDQYKLLLQAIPEINAALKEEGIDVGESALPDEEADPAPRRAKAKKEKANIEETSDEDDE
ncbi:RNA polymerase II transcriptional coactivator [Hyphodiscus hymeniophilus]|uniref:RNA polymerase II transcriptional coactivator n=1 Tax=Hyphodiscus hymeniophilus TaxID=353542 RepID=A0A9P7B067_9HELO|nr:RNA polymerase II transcriptional coactivator [Hyphodiscus hymeniophilus]